MAIELTQSPAIIFKQLLRRRLMTTLPVWLAMIVSASFISAANPTLVVTPSGNSPTVTMQTERPATTPPVSGVIGFNTPQLTPDGPVPAIAPDNQTPASSSADNSPLGDTSTAPATTPPADTLSSTVPDCPACPDSSLTCTSATACATVPPATLPAPGNPYLQPPCNSCGSSRLNPALMCPMYACAAQ